MTAVETYRRAVESSDRERRRRLARLSYDEKLAILEKLRRAAQSVQSEKWNVKS